MLHVRLAKPSIGFSWFYRIAINSPPSTTSLYQSYSALGVLSWYVRFIFFWLSNPQSTKVHLAKPSISFCDFTAYNKLAAIHRKSIKVKVIVNFWAKAIWFFRHSVTLLYKDAIELSSFYYSFNQLQFIVKLSFHWFQYLKKDKFSIVWHCNRKWEGNPSTRYFFTRTSYKNLKLPRNN